MVKNPRMSVAIPETPTGPENMRAADEPRCIVRCTCELLPGSEFILSGADFLLSIDDERKMRGRERAIYLSTVDG